MKFRKPWKKSSRLLSASKEGKTEKVLSLLRHPSINPNYHDNEDPFPTPLLAACQQGHVAIVKALLSHPATLPNLPTRFSQTPLYLAATAGHVETVAMLLADRRVAVSTPTITGRTPLLSACNEGHVEVVGCFLAHPGVNPNLQARDGETPLLVACYHGYVEIVRLLLEDPRTNPNIPCVGGKTAFHEACYHGNAQSVEHVRFERGEEEEGGGGDGFGEFQLEPGVPLEKRLEIIRLLLGNPRLNVNYRDDNGKTGFYWACERGDPETIQSLASCDRVDVMIGDLKGVYPLSLVFEIGLLPGVQWILAMWKDEQVEREICQLTRHWKEEQEKRGYQKTREIRSFFLKRIWGRQEREKLIGKGFLEVVQLLEDFMENPFSVRDDLRRILGIADKYASRTYALGVFLSDGMLRIKRGKEEKEEKKEEKKDEMKEERFPNEENKRRFWAILARLPQELQMGLSNVLQGIPAYSISHLHSDIAFKEVVSMF